MVQEVIEVLIATALGVSVRVVWRYLQRCPPPKKIIQGEP
jgi:lambda repressor-like predicted transcriptional regulator